MLLKSERLILWPINAKDIEWLRETRNKNKDKFFDTGEISKEQQRVWYEKYQDCKTDQMFIIRLKSGQSIGTIALYNIDIGKRIAILGRVLLLDEYRGNGYAEEAVKSMLDLAFNSMCLFKIRVEVFEDNKDAIAIYNRSGFKMLTRPILIMEKINNDINWNAPIKIESYDDMSDSYEGQNTNVA